MSRTPTSGGVLAKLAVMVGATALTAAWLLSVRQQRIMAAHDLIQAHRRTVQNEQALWRLRTDIANLLTPDRIEQIAGASGTMRPITPDDTQPDDKALAHSRDGQQPGSDYR
jgi:hypothetical protein